MNKRPSLSLSNHPTWGAIQIAAVYLLVGGLWILFSDQVAARIAPSEQMLTVISLYKGWAYVLITALLLYLLIQRHTARLRASEMQLHRILDSLPALISYVDRERRYQFTNSAYQDWFEGQLLGKHVQEVIGAPAYKSISQYIDRVFSGETVHYETEVSLPDGERFVQGLYVPDIEVDGSVKGYFALIHDLTEQKKGREELQLWADAFEGCYHGIAIGDPDTNRIVVCNPAFAGMLKRSVEDIVGAAILSLYAPSDHERVRRNIQRADQIGHARYEAHMIRKDGSIFPVQMDIVSVLGEDGELLHRVLTAQDISERKQAEENLRKNEERYRHLFENNPHPMWTYDRETLTFLDVNEAAIQKYGYSCSEFLQMTIADIRPAEDVERLKEHLSQSRPALQHSEGWRHRLKDGTVIDVEITSHIVEIDDHEAALVVAQDVTERKRAEEKLRESEAKYRTLVEHLPVITYISEPDAYVGVSFISPQIESYGFDPDTWLADPELWFRRLHPDDQARVKSELEQFEADAESFKTEYRLILPNGEARWFHDESIRVKDQGGKTILKQGFMLDITEDKQAEEYLRRFELLSEHSRDIILFMGREDGRILEANAAAVRAYGYSREELLSLTIRDLRAPDTLSLTAEQMAQADARGILFETTHRRKDGSTFPVEVSSQGAKIGGARTLISIIRDITERKHAEEALRLKDQLLHLTSEMAKVGGWEFDPQTGKGTWTDEVARIHDIDPTQATNVEIGLSVYAGESREKIEQAVKEAIEFGRPYDLELEMVSAKGDRKWVRTMALPIMHNDQVVKVQGIFQDITERKQIEKALQAAHDELEIKVQERTAALSEANALLKALMDNIPDHIYFKDLQSCFIRTSRSQANLLGLSEPAGVIGKSDFDFFPHAARAYDEEQEVMRSGTPLIDLEEWVVWPDGRETWVSTTKMPLRNADGQTIGIFGISHDITERKRTEQEIKQLNADLEKQAEKLWAANKELEAFSYSVSHDLRAPLRAVDGYTRILVEDYESVLDAEGKRICGIISREARRMGQLIDDLLAFSRLGRKEMYTSSIDIRGMVVSVLNELLKEEERARLDFQIGKLPAVKADSSLIRQVWFNLLANAIKFTSRKERAVIEIGSKTTKEELIYYVRDTGAGFDMEYANKLFGVFQRLHSESEFDGTGVGLAIVQRIIHRHEGRVWAEGEVEKGATFYFALPRKEDHHE